MRPVAHYLECGHCGEPAIYSANGFYWEGQDGPCVSCGFPGYVSVDENGNDEFVASWRELNDGRCADPACDDCRGPA